MYGLNYHSDMAQYILNSCMSIQGKGKAKATFLMLNYGSDLQQLLKENFKSLSNFKKLDFMLQIALAVAKLHQNNVYHFHLKPANIFLQNDFGIVLGDFGFAKEKSDIPSGTIILRGAGPSYVEEEATKKETFVPPEKQDIYAAGVIFFEILFGKRKDGYFKEEEIEKKEESINELLSKNKNLDSLGLQCFEDEFILNKILGMIRKMTYKDNVDYRGKMIWHALTIASCVNLCAEYINDQYKKFASEVDSSLANALKTAENYQPDEFEKSAQAKELELVVLDGIISKWKDRKSLYESKIPVYTDDSGTKVNPMFDRLFDSVADKTVKEKINQKEIPKRTGSGLRRTLV